MAFPQDPRTLLVELFLDGVWTDVTSDVRQTDPVIISFGSTGEGSAVQPTQCRFTLDDTDGDYNPRNPLGQWFGMLGRNTSVRVAIDGRRRFIGELSKLTPRWNTSQTDRHVLVEAGALLRRLEQSTAPLRSSFRRLMTAPGRPAPVAYWPCEENRDAEELLSATGAPPMTVTGDVEFGSFDRFVASEPIPVLNEFGALVGRVPPYPDTEQAVRVTCLMFVPAEGVTGFRVPLLAVTTTGTMSRWTLGTNDIGDIEIIGHNAQGVQVLASSTPFAGNGELRMLSLELTQSGSDIVWEYGTTTVGESVFSFATNTLVGHTLGVATAVQVGGTTGTGELVDVAFGHIAVFNSPLVFDTDLTAALRAHVGEEPIFRMNRLCSEENVPIVFSDLVSSPTMGPQPVTTLLEALNDAEAVDMGVLVDRRDEFQLIYRTRNNLVNQFPTVTPDYATGQVAPTLEPTEDDKNTRNEVTISKPRGGELTVQRTEGPLNSADPPDGVGRYEYSAEVNVQHNSQVAGVAGWLLHLGTVDEPRFPRVRVDLAASPELTIAASLVEVGSRIVITDAASVGYPDDIELLVRGYTETLTNGFAHDVVFNCVPERPYHTLVLDEDYRLGNDASALNEDLTTTETDVSVFGATRWTIDGGDVPFDIVIGGERMTVTAASGSGAAQTLTVTRSVNGVVKTHATGVDVRLADTRVFGL